eukprot:Phypoly_transcript_04992.p1 GENE.Phypoly_transcript_04992~~Phypoly_transcript_04992.p1  ORF type:complete len:617 (+),score=44.79 Phypoly_transcript_04992:132-1982(+)
MHSRSRDRQHEQEVELGIVADELEIFNDRHQRSTWIRKNQLKLTRESPVNPLIAENLPYTPVFFGYAMVIPCLIFILYIGGYYTSGQGNPLHLLWHLSVQQASQALGSNVRTTTNLLVLLISSSGVILQLANNRYQVNTYRLFFSDKIINFMLAFATFSTAYSALISYSAADTSIYVHFHFISSLVLLLATILISFPYFYYLFDWLDPVKLVHRLQARVLESITSNDINPALIDNNKIKCIRYLDYLADIARYEIQTSGKSVAFSVIDSIMMICHHYLKLKSKKKKEWFAIPYWVRQTPDFISMSQDLFHELEEGQIWLEFKIFRSLLSLYREGVKDLSFLITTHTRKLAERAIMSKDINLLNLCIRFLNTYLRTAISGSQTRMAYTVMDQYRLLCEFIVVTTSSDELDCSPQLKVPTTEKLRSLKSFLSERWTQKVLAANLRNENSRSGTETEQQYIEDLLIKVVGVYWVYYHRYGTQKDLDLVAETIAHDQATLLEIAFVCNTTKHDEMLASLLNPAYPIKKTRGTLRAYVKLATSYIVLGAEQHARAIAHNFQGTTPNTLQRVWQDLLAVEDRDFWEINDRLVNFNYLTPEQKEALPLFFSFFNPPVTTPIEL